MSDDLVKCKQCDIPFKNQHGWSPDGIICSKCSDSDLFGTSKPDITENELKRINKMGGRSSQPTPTSATSSPTNIQTNSISFWKCQQCNNKVETSKDCSCGRKSPFSRRKKL